MVCVCDGKAVCAVLSKLEIGIQKPLRIRQERVSAPSELRLLYASDLHLRPANQGVISAELLGAAERTRPELILLGGDLADHRASLARLTDMVAKLAAYGPVAAVPGNHDTLLGLSLVREAILQGGGYWLTETPILAQGIQVLGRPEQRRGSRFSVLCGHYPTTFPKARSLGVDLCLAGHLHGWQIVLGQRGEYLYPGALLSRWNGPRFEREQSTLLVSQGMTDLLPLRWNCPREVLLVESV